MFLFTVGSADAAPGVLDPSFGAGSGEVTTSIGTSAAADAVVLQPDGKIVAAGGVTEANKSQDFALARYEPDGALDPTFGSGGIVQTPAGTVRALALQPDGKIVAAGTTFTQIRIVRYDANGSLDQSFGSGGVTTTPVGTGVAEANALVLQPDGRIVVGGESSDGSQTLFTLVRYDANGSLDPTFGSGGIVTTQVGTADSSVEALALQPDGRIVADGDALNASSLAVPGLARYNADGSLDSTFGSGGIVTTPVYGSENVTGGPLALQPDGKIVAAGTWQRTGSGIVARYETNGSLDPGFGSGGSATVSGGSSVVLQPDGKILVAGSGTLMTTELLTFSRLNPDGSSDGTFCECFGSASLTVWAGPDEPTSPMSPAIALQPDGKIVAAGSESDDSGVTQKFLLARLGASTLTVNFADDPAGGVGGTITSSPAGLDCVADYACTYPGFLSLQRAFAAGPVTLTATPSNGWFFDGWSGDGCSGTGTCQVHMSGDVSDDQAVTARFASAPPTLDVLKAGSGAGTVTSSPRGIDCKSRCSHIFDYGTAVTLTAHASRGSRFTGWSGSGCGGRGACTVPVNGVRVVTASFQGFCIVPRLKGQTLRIAKSKIRKAHCRTGTIRRSYSNRGKGHVVSQRPRAERHLRGGAKVDLVISKGKRP